MLTKMITAFIILLVVSFNADAGEHSYNCKIMHIYELDNDGSLKISDLEKQYKGTGFVISRVTGEIIGGDVVPTLITSSTNVIIKRYSEHHFKSFAEFAYQYQSTQSNGFIPEGRKSFFAISTSGNKFITGVCK